MKRYQLSVAYVVLEVVSPYLDGETGTTSVEVALSASCRTAVIGEAGTGKTTLLYWLAVNSAGNSFGPDMSEWRHTVPFIIELRRYPKELPSPEDFISKVAF